MRVFHRFPEHWSDQTVDAIYNFLYQLETDFWTQFEGQLCEHWQKEKLPPFDNPDDPPPVEEEDGFDTETP
jgi:hypothetical protein